MDDFEAALAGDERAQLRTVIRMLSNHMASLLWFPNEIPESLKKCTLELIKSALELVDKGK